MHVAHTNLRGRTRVRLTTGVAQAVMMPMMRGAPMRVVAVKAARAMMKRIVQASNLLRCGRTRLWGSDG
jgi:hypothetical protein